MVLCDHRELDFIVQNFLNNIAISCPFVYEEWPFRSRLQFSTFIPNNSWRLIFPYVIWAYSRWETPLRHADHSCQVCSVHKLFFELLHEIRVSWKSWAKLYLLFAANGRKVFALWYLSFHSPPNLLPKPYKMHSQFLIKYVAKVHISFSKQPEERNLKKRVKRDVCSESRVFDSSFHSLLQSIYCCLVVSSRDLSPWEVQVLKWRDEGRGSTKIVHLHLWERLR